MSRHFYFWLFVLFLLVSSILSSMIAKQNNHRNRYILNFSPFARPVRFYLRNHESLKKPKSCHNYKKKKPIPHIKKQHHHPHCNHKPRKKLKKVQKTKKLETTEDCSSYPDSHNFDTILKFLAHLHHQVDEVGKPPHKALDLKKVESMIESCKHLTAKSAVLGSGQSTECAPLELNDLSIDMEWNELGGGSSSTTNAANGKNGVKARKVFDEIFKQGNRGAQSDDTLYLYLDEEDEKKEPPVKRSTNQKVDKVISDISSSLHKFKTRKRNPKFNAVYSDDDLSSLDTSDYEYSEKDDEDEECVALNTVKGQKANRRKAAKPKKKKSSKSEKPLRENEEHKDPDDQNPFRHFSELNDIQFRVNPDQEQDIATFIENLNTPPEIFSFDVEKYMKPEIESSAPNREFVDEPKRQYYEFIETPNIDSEPVPLIPPTYQESESNLKVLNKKGNAEAPIKKRSYGKSQRDLLRQYIKGVSSSLIGQNLPLASESTSSNKDGKPAKNFDSLNGENESKEAESKESLSPDRERENISNRAKALIENYGNNLYAMNYVKYGNNDKASDDFIDNYYLLNDGSYKKEEPAPTHSNKFSSYDIQIDRDLDRKFADLNYQKTGDLNIHNYPILKPIDEEETKEAGQNVDKL